MPGTPEPFQIGLCAAAPAMTSLAPHVDLHNRFSPLRSMILALWHWGRRGRHKKLCGSTSTSSLSLPFGFGAAASQSRR